MADQGTAIGREGQAIDRAANAAASTVEHMSVNRRRTHILVAQQLLDRPNIMPVLQQVGCKGMAKRMTGCRFGDPCCEPCFLEG